MLMFLLSIAFARELRVAIIDTGVDRNYLHDIKLCEDQAYSFDYQDVYDYHHLKHGTNVAGIITSASNKNVCYIIINAWNGEELHVIRSLEWLKTLNPDIINMSLNGLTYDALEDKHLKYFLDKGVKVVVAAGNEGLNLNIHCISFPACSDPRLIVVGNTDSTSNKGKIVDIIKPYRKIKAFGTSLSGTSQSAAEVTKDLINGTR